MKFDLSSFSSDNIRSGVNYIKNNGIREMLSRMKYKQRGPGAAYDSWYKDVHEADEEELARQREEQFSYAPVVSILVSVYMTPEYFLRTMIESVCKQTYGNWELCIVDGSQVDSETDEQAPTDRYYGLETERVIRSYAETEPRIHYVLLDRDPGISDTINTAMELATGEYIALLDHDDVLSEDALYCFVKALQEKHYDVLYSDEDRMSEDGAKFLDPVFKPDYNPDLLRAYNYISHLCMVKKSLAASVGGFCKLYDGAQDYDFILKCCETVISCDKREWEELIDGGIRHISRVLYHRRMHRRTMEKEQRIELARETGRRALEADLNRMDCYAVVNRSDIPGMYRVIYDTPGNPLLSVIVTSTGNVEDMERCLMPFYYKSRYSNFEIIVVDVERDNKDLDKFYRQIESMRKNVHIVAGPAAATLPELRNYGAMQAQGEYLLFLDGNTEIIDNTAIGEMLGLCMRREVGIASGVLYTDSDLVWKSAYALGINGVATDMYRGIHRGEYGYQMRNRVNCDYSAVSASCMMVKTALYKRMGGFSEKFASVLSDLDFCLRVRETGYLIVSAADAGWYCHGITMSKPIEDSVAPAERDLFCILWDRILREGDPFYNPNFAREGDPFTL